MNGKTGRIVIIFLGLTVLVCVATLGALAVQQIDIPPSLSGITGAALGALTGLLPVLFIVPPSEKKNAGLSR